MAVVKLNNPKANQLNLPFLEEIHHTISVLEREDEVDGVVICSGVPKVFCSGLDLNELVDAQVSLSLSLSLSLSVCVCVYVCLSLFLSSRLFLSRFVSLVLYLTDCSTFIACILFIPLPLKETALKNYFTTFQDVFKKLYTSPLFTIAAINGK